MLGGAAIGFYLIADKVLHRTDMMSQHGPLMIFTAVLIIAGVQLLALGLLGEMQVRHYHEPTHRAPYAVQRVLRAQSEERTISE